jgi:hypothetical protein
MPHHRIIVDEQNVHVAKTPGSVSGLVQARAACDPGAEMWDPRAGSQGADLLMCAAGVWAIVLAQPVIRRQQAMVARAHPAMVPRLIGTPRGFSAAPWFSVERSYLIFC